MAFGYYKTLTADHVQCGGGGALANFSAVYNTTDADLANVAHGGYVQNANGYDIQAFADSSLSTPLYYELVNYDATTGDIEIWINCGTGASEINSSSDAVIYLAYGDASISTDGSSTSAFDTYDKSRYHLGDGSTLSLKDSTATGATLTNNNSITAASGEIWGGTAQLNGTNQYLSNTSGPSIAPTDCITISWWRYYSSAALQQASAFAITNGSSTAIQAHAPWSDSGLYFDYNYGDFTNGRVSTSYSSYLGTRALIHLTRDENTGVANIIINGVLAATKTASSTRGAAISNLSIGYGQSVVPYYDHGQYDEFRISAGSSSAAARSVPWCLAEYNNQKAGSTFFTPGTNTPVGGGGGFTAVNRRTFGPRVGSRSFY